MSELEPVIVWASFPLFSFVEIFAACLMLACHQPRRQHFDLRVGCVLASFALVALCLATLLAATGSVPAYNHLPGDGTAGTTGVGIVIQTAGFGLFLLAMLPALKLCFDMSGWSAFFCATSGYALQNFASSLAELFALVLTALGRPLPVRAMGLFTFLCCLFVYRVMYQQLIARINRAEYDVLTNRSLLPMLTVVLFAVIGFDVVLKSSAYDAVTIGTALMTRVFHGVFCLFTLFVEIDLVVRRQLTIEVATAERLMAEHERQLQMSRENIDAINLKCHDLRHQIRHLADGGTTVDAAVLADVARDVNMYDSTVRTGNQALDTILTEKRLLAEQLQVTLTCVADGTALSFMAPADLYALFGNALDNALEAVADIADPARRSISLLVHVRAGMAQIHVENTCATMTQLVDGLPQTSKLDDSGVPDTTNHGFGTRSMRAIVERYGGTLTYTPRPETFSLDAMLPLES